MPKDDIVVAVCGSLKLTNKKITQESNNFWSGATEEIPINKLDSIGAGYKRNLTLFIIGIIVFIAGLILLSVPVLNVLLIAVGAAFTLLGLTRRVFVELRAGTLKLSESSSGAIEFAEKVRTELHKKNYV